ncbi:hypothetical protein CN931_08585 [Bacillus sp. AFS054943]|nr:hypothetical protein CN931_08585 [Bacillus sp. AFS054943]
MTKERGNLSFFGVKIFIQFLARILTIIFLYNENYGEVSMSCIVYLIYRNKTVKVGRVTDL